MKFQNESDAEYSVSNYASPNASVVSFPSKSNCSNSDPNMNNNKTIQNEMKQLNNIMPVDVSGLP